MTRTAISAHDNDYATTCDAFLGGAVHVHQPSKGYRAGLDAVLLAATVPAPDERRPLRLLDVGAGVGVVGLCAATRLSTIDATLIEQDAQLCRLARDNIAKNDLGQRVRVVEHDIARRIGTPEYAARQQLTDNGFDVTVSNPPFYNASDHRQSPHALKAVSHAMPDAGLDNWLRYMARMTKSGGIAIMIHRADQLPALLTAFGRRFGAITVLPLYPRAGASASRVILRGIKGSRAALRISPGICLHGADNRFTPMIDNILKSPTSLDLDADI